MEVSPGADTVSYAGSEGNDNGLGIREVSHGPGPSYPIETHVASEGSLLLVQRPLPSAEQRGYKGQTNGTLET